MVAGLPSVETVTATVESPVGGFGDGADGSGGRPSMVVEVSPVAPAGMDDVLLEAVVAGHVHHDLALLPGRGPGDRLGHDQ